MDWIQVFVIIGVFIGGYFHLSSKIGDVNTNLTKKIDDVNTNLSNKIDKCAKAQDLSYLTGKVMDLNRDIGILIGQSISKVTPFQEEPKKKAKGE